MAQSLFSQDSYTYAKVINGAKKYKTLNRIDTEKLDDLGTVPTSTQKGVVKTLVDAMAGVTAGTWVPMQEDPDETGAIYKYRVNRTVPITELE